MDCAAASPTPRRDWRNVDGIAYAFEQKTTVGSVSGTSALDRVTHAEAVPDTAFAVPEKVREIAARQGGEARTGCRIEKTETQLAATIRLRVKAAEISKQLAVVLPEFMQHLDAVDVTPAGAPFTRYHEMGKDELVIEAVPTTSSSRATPSCRSG